MVGFKLHILTNHRRKLRAEWVLCAKIVLIDVQRPVQEPVERGTVIVELGCTEDRSYAPDLRQSIFGSAMHLVGKWTDWGWRELSPSSANNHEND